MIEKTGKLPVNSEIFIDYTKEPPEITFGYPDPDTKIVRRSSVTGLIALVLGSVMFLILLGLYMFYIQPVYYPSIGNKNTIVNDVKISDFEYANGSHYGFSHLNVFYTWNNKSQFTTLSLEQKGILFVYPYFYQSETKYLLSITLQAIILVCAYALLYFLNTLWVAKVFKSTKWGNRKFPVLNKKLLDAKFSAEFTPENFPTNTNIIEIPLFKNIYMDYDAEDDFAEQLQKISIVEHPFNHLIKKGLPFSKERKSIVKKTNVYLWKCIFEFKNKPVNGKMEVRFT